MKFNVGFLNQSLQFGKQRCWGLRIESVEVTVLPRQIGLKRAELTLEHRIIHSMKTVQFVKNQRKGFPAKKHQNHPAERLTGSGGRCLWDRSDKGGTAPLKGPRDRTHPWGCHPSLYRLSSARGTGNQGRERPRKWPRRRGRRWRRRRRRRRRGRPRRLRQDRPPPTFKIWSSFFPRVPQLAHWQDDDQRLNQDRWPSRKRVLVALSGCSKTCRYLNRLTDGSRREG